MYGKSITKTAFILMVLGVLVYPAKAAIWTDPTDFNISTVEGVILNDTLTIGNNGLTDLTFSLRSRETSRETSQSNSIGGAVVSMPAATEKTITLEYNFNLPVITKGTQYDTIQMAGLESYQRDGAPIVPVRPATILVPLGKKVVGTRVIALDSVELPGTYLLAPAQKPYPLSFKGKVQQTAPDPAIYGRNSPWPEKNHEKKDTCSKRGYQLLTVNLFPVQYVPATGRITYTTKMRLEIRLADSQSLGVVRTSPQTIKALKKRIDNPAALASYGSAKAQSAQALNEVSPLPGGGPYQYVIITNQTLAGVSGQYSFQALRDAKIASGVSATIVTTEWIYANYNGTKPSGGSDNQTRIRNFLIDAYQEWGTEYVLLGGTTAIVPARLFYVDSYAGEIDYMPVDMYYGCVDPPTCTFDNDADNKYGEPTDGPGGSDVDLYAEIYVGRATVENATEMQNFVRKTLTYASTYNDYLPKVSMLGEYLGFGGVAEYAKPAMEQIRLGGSYDGYFTYGFENNIQPDFYDFDTSANLYDADGTWPKSSLINLMNSGVHIFNHLGHANETYNMKLYTSDLSSLTNTDYFFAYSQGCDSGAFDVTNCFAEVLTTIEHGAFADIMNARYGWGTLNSTDGPSHRFARQFWDAALGEDKLELGRANQDSKEDNLWDINGSCIRWCYYELNLFGDPQQVLRFEEACQWITLDPQQGTVAPATSTDVDVTFDAMTLAPGIYGAQIVINSNDPCTPVKTVPVTMTLSADDLQVTPATGLDSNGTQGGPFVPARKTYTLTNNSDSIINWTTLEYQDWLNITPSQGSIEPHSSVDVNVCIDVNANLLDPNIYSQVLTFQNLNSGSVKTRSITLTVNPPDLFTESFDAGGNFKSLSLTLRPNGSIACYEACRDEATEFPTDPNGGTYLPLGDDDYAQVVLTGGKHVWFYNQSYDRFYVGSNGYITFGTADTGFSGTLDDHFALPRISGYFTDLTPANSHSISYKQLDDKVAVKFRDVPIFGDKNAKNSFQIELFFGDGSIRITWLKLAAVAGVAGISEGYGLPEELFQQSNFREYPVCWPTGDYNKDYIVDLADLAIFVSHWLDENCDYPLWCEKTDLDFSSFVDGVDFSAFALNWGITKSTMPSPISWWKFDEGQGTVAYDSVGDNDGNVYGAIWTTGQINGALNFDGVNDYVNVPNNSSQQIATNQITLAAWIMLKADVGNTQTRIICKQTVGNGGISWGFEIFGNGYDGSTGNQLVFHDTSGTAQYKCYSQTHLGLNRWYYVAVTDNAGKIRIYIDGLLDKACDNGYGIPAQINAPIQIGCVESEKFFNGVIDDVRFYDAALSAEEILQLYQEGLSKKATNPNPADGQTAVDPNVVVNWSPGNGALTHDVYFGTNFNEVNDADISDANVYMGNQDVNYWDVKNHDSNGLEPDTTFYWRIDELSGTETTKGNVWTFKTSVIPGLVGWWKFDEGTGTIAYDSAENRNGTVNGAIWTTGKIEGALNFDGANDYVGLPNNNPIWLPENDFTTAAWVYFDTDPATRTHDFILGLDFTYYEDHTSCTGIALFRSLNNGKAVFQIETINTTDGLSSNDVLQKNRWYHVVSVRQGTTQRIYLDGSLNASQSCSGEPIKYSGTCNDDKVNIGRTSEACWNPPYYLDGKIDDVRIYNRALSAEEILQLYQEGLSKKATNPSPADGQTTVDPNVVFNWLPGKNALTHDVYFGTSFNEVNDADISDANVYMGNHDVNYWDVRNHDPNGLEPNTIFYWRIDELSSAETTKGDVWTFRTESEEFDPNLIAWWRFDEGAGTIAYDSAGDNDGNLINGPIWTTGLINGALNFDGINDYVNIPDSNSLDLTSQATLSAWINTKSLTAAQGIVGRWNYAGGPPYKDSILLEARGDVSRKIRFLISTSDQDSGVTVLPSNQQFNTNTWYHIAGTYDGVTMKLYINGQLDNYIAKNGNIFVSNSNWYIGAFNYGNIAYFNGLIDDVRVYDTALSADEIWQLYQGGL
jgi:hypothetical protein